MRQREPRRRDPGYLAWLRTQGCCCGCDRAAPSDAAHLRVGVTGMGRKPDDDRALPLNHSCHMRQHAHGDEAAWFRAHAINPLQLAGLFYARYQRENPKAPAPYVRKQRPVKKRKPRELRAKLKSRNTLRRRS